jgi:hypothetical protein
MAAKFEIHVSEFIWLMLTVAVAGMGLSTSILCGVLYGLGFYLLVPILFIGIGIAAGKLPEPLRGPIQSAIMFIFMKAFNLQSVSVENVAAWGGKGPAASKLPAAINGCVFMKGNPAPDAIADLTYGEWNAEKRTLLIRLSHPGVWSYNNNMIGLALWVGAWLLNASYTFYFDEKFESVRSGPHSDR